MILKIIIICIIGTLLHFTYDLSNHNKFIGLFSAVNESTWEHIKMALTPIFLCSIVDGIYLSNFPNYFLSKFVEISTVIVFIPLVFYTYTHILKKRILIIDILSFYIAIIISSILFKYILSIKTVLFNEHICLVGIFIIFAIYMIATLYPFKGIIFKDPITKKYGYAGHK